jgi:glutamyl-tRNA reductase
VIDRLVVLGISHQTAPLAIRERIAHLSEDPGLSLRRLRELPGVSEGMLLSTCNRVELYGAGAPAERVVAGFRGLMAQAPEVMPHLYERRGEAALKHLFRVASSLDSMVVGEPQILGQLKHAFQQATVSGNTGDTLHRAVGRAFAVAKRVRTETAVGRAAVSMVHAAIELSERVFKSLEGKRALLLGAGEMSSLAAQRLIAHRVEGLVIANRTLAHAEALVHRLEGRGAAVRAVGLDDLGEQLIWADFVVSAVAAEGLLVTRDQVRAALKTRRYRPLMCVDLAVPRSIDPQLGSLENVYVKDVDDVGRLVTANSLRRSEEARRAEQIVDGEVESFARVLRGRSAAPVLAALRQKASLVAADEAERTLQRIGSALDEAQSASVRAMAQAIVNKLLHEPTARLRAAAEARDESPLADAASELFALGGLEETNAWTPPPTPSREREGKIEPSPRSTDEGEGKNEPSPRSTEEREGKIVPPPDAQGGEDRSSSPSRSEGEGREGGRRSVDPSGAKDTEVP